MKNGADVDELGTLESLWRLVEQSGAVGSQTDLASFLDATAEAISRCLGFSVVVINLYRPAWDDFIASTCRSDHPGARLLLGTTNRLEDFSPLLDERFDHSGAYLARMDVEQTRLGAVYVPDLAPVDDPDTWGPRDWLLVPMRRSSGEIVGMLSVDQPTSGRRPSERALRMLVAFTSCATAAVENARQAAASAEHRRALEHLLRVSTRLGHAYDLQELLQAVCDGASTALGFEKVAVELMDRTSGVLRTKAATGWRAGGGDSGAPYSLSDVSALFDPAFEIAGCYLIPGDIAAARVPARVVPPESVRNGTGPRAWSGHWLLVPLHDPAGKIEGLIWADDPMDFMLPTEEKLVALSLFANQAARAIDAHERASQLRGAHAMRRRLLKRIVDIVEEERTRIAGDLHDGPIQRLTALTLRLEIARMAASRGDPQASQEAIEEVQSQIGEEISLLRRLMSELRPPVLDQRGLLDALRDHAARLEEGTGLLVSVEGGTETLDGVPPEVETVLYRIVQEALTNVVKHAGAAHAQIRFLDSDEFVRLEVSDDGVGFDISQPAAGGHLGLVGMRERAEMAGGSLQVESRPGEGTTVRAWVPRSSAAVGVGRTRLEPATDWS
ncbi:MAG: ATP-binding protein [Actinomycetota bacterium]